MRMDKSDLTPLSPSARFAVDHLNSQRQQMPDGNGEIVDPEGQMVNPPSTGGEKPTDRTFASLKGLKQFKPRCLAIAGTSASEHSRLDRLIGNDLASLLRELENIAEKTDCTRVVFGRNPEMANAKDLKGGLQIRPRWRRRAQ